VKDAKAPTHRSVRGDTVESEDVLAERFRGDDLVDEDTTEEEEEDEEQTEEEFREEGGESEATDEASYDEEADEEGVSGSDSEFDISDVASVSSEESPIRRASTRRPTTDNPKKRSSARSRGTSAVQPSAATPAKEKASKLHSAFKTGGKGRTGSISSPTAISSTSPTSPFPLGERLGQDGDDEDVVPVMVKRKR
jgi:hypothetical protein